jgi:hypothetical protein
MMELFSVIRASTFRALKPWLFDKIIPLELVTAVKEKYQFIQAPEGNQLNQPFSFQAGKFRNKDNRTITIEQLVVAYVGSRATSIGVSTRTSSDDSESFLDELIAWASETYNLETAEVFSRSYFSQVEFVLPEPLSHHFDEFRSMAQAITTLVRGYGQKDCPLFEFTGFSINIDAVGHSELSPMPQPFVVDRRAGSPYAENKYFSQAPLRTQDHRAVLEQLEAFLRK